jgi:hypothetical protein
MFSAGKEDMLENWDRLLTLPSISQKILRPVSHSFLIQRKRNLCQRELSQKRVFFDTGPGERLML